MWSSDGENIAYTAGSVSAGSGLVVASTVNADNESEDIVEADEGINVKYGTKSTASPAVVVQNAYGIKIDALHEGGQIDNSYGLYISTPKDGGTVTNKWALYQADSNTGNYLAGDVGIGVEDAAYKLDVDGDINISGQIFSNGTPITSDIRYKKDVQTLTGALDGLGKLRGVSYNWKKDAYPASGSEDRTQLGFIAQEVEEVYPGLVSTAKDGHKAVDYARLLPVVVEAVKEQQDQIETLKSENAVLKAQKVEFENRLGEMEMMKLRMAALEVALSRMGSEAIIQSKLSNQ